MTPGSLPSRDIVVPLSGWPAIGRLLRCLRTSSAVRSISGRSITAGVPFPLRPNGQA